jgi:hypothetical protein
MDGGGSARAALVAGPISLPSAVVDVPPSLLGAAAGGGCALAVVITGHISLPGTVSLWTCTFYVLMYGHVIRFWS